MRVLLTFLEVCKISNINFGDWKGYNNTMRRMLMSCVVDNVSHVEQDWSNIHRENAVLVVGVVSAFAWLSLLPPDLWSLTPPPQSSPYQVLGLWTPDDRMPALLIVWHSSQVSVGSADGDGYTTVIRDRESSINRELNFPITRFQPTELLWHIRNRNAMHFWRVKQAVQYFTRILESV